MMGEGAIIAIAKGDDVLVILLYRLSPDEREYERCDQHEEEGSTRGTSRHHGDLGVVVVVVVVRSLSRAVDKTDIVARV